MSDLMIYGFIGDDMPTCPTCGTRCEILEQIDDDSQRLQCLNKKCGLEFIGEWEEESDDEIDPVEQLVLAGHGYTNLRKVNGLVCGIMRFIYTVGVCYGLDETGYVGRYCFDTHQNAALFLGEWDGKVLPVIGEDGCTAIK